MAIDDLDISKNICYVEEKDVSTQVLDNSEYGEEFQENLEGTT